MTIGRLSGPLLTFLILTIRLYSQNPPFTIRVDAASVMLEAIVEDENGRPITELTQSDFSIYEDGQLQQIGNFTAASTLRSILLLMDRFVEPPYIPEGANSFLRTLKPQDRIAVAAFDRDVRTVLNWRPTQAGLQQEVTMPKFPVRAQMQSTTYVYKSLEQVSRLFRDEKGRKGILVFTNGFDDAVMGQILKFGEPLELSRDSEFNKHLAVLKKAGIPLYIVAVATDRNYSLDKPHRTWFWNDLVKINFLVGVRLRLEKLAEVTGGRTYIPTNLDDLLPLYRQIALDLGNSYSLTYIPNRKAADGSRHRIEVRVREGWRVIQSRSEYLAQ